MASAHIEHKLSLLPDLPGSYQMKDINGKIIYVGKAKNLKNRVRSYFKSSHDGKVAAMVSQVADFDFIVTSTDKEAFLLEITLIQKYQPYYNIKLKKGTGYPYIKITHESLVLSVKMAVITLGHTQMSMRRKKPCILSRRFIHCGAVMAIKADRACIITWVSVWVPASGLFRKRNTRTKLNVLSAS